MLILGVDFETTGLVTETDRIIEVGAVLWDTVRGMPLQILSELIWYEGIWDDASATKEKIEQTTKIAYNDLVKYGKDPVKVLTDLTTLMSTPNLAAMVAHNGNEFDKPILYANAKRLNITIPEVSWIDTMIDIPFESHIQTRKLTHLACDHGFINPFAHRAIFDSLTMLKMLQNYDIEWIFKICQEPLVTLISLGSFQQKEEVKARGFRWYPDSGKWIKKVRESQVQNEKSLATFSVKEVR